MLMLNPIMVGMMLVASKVIDAVTDLMAGYFVDRTNTRFGKGCPYEIFIVLSWIFTNMMFPECFL